MTKITIGCKRRGTDIAISKILKSKGMPLFYIVGLTHIVGQFFTDNWQWPKADPKLSKIKCGFSLLFLKRKIQTAQSHYRISREGRALSRT